MAKGDGSGRGGGLGPGYPYGQKLDKRTYKRELGALQVELVKAQHWVREAGERGVLLAEGRDAAGKGGAIQRFTANLNPRGARVVALGKPDETERGQWYYQRYVRHLPTRGEIMFFDRSWYNRAGVERVMGFCSEEEYREFLRSAPEFEQMLIRSGITLIKYWFSVSDEEQDRRFQSRLEDRTKRWKISPMDLESRKHWFDYSKAKDVMFHHTDIPQSPWWVVDADNKKRARLNCIHHLLSMLPYKEVEPPDLELPPRQEPDPDYVRPPIASMRWVPAAY